jgi:hypothetical protein
VRPVATFCLSNRVSFYPNVVRLSKQDYRALGVNGGAPNELGAQVRTEKGVGNGQQRGPARQIVTIEKTAMLQVRLASLETTTKGEIDDRSYEGQTATARELPARTRPRGSSGGAQLRYRFTVPRALRVLGTAAFSPMGRSLSFNSIPRRNMLNPNSNRPSKSLSNNAGNASL